MKFLRVEMLFLIWAVPVMLLAYFYGGRKRRGILRAFAKQGSLVAQRVPGLTGRRRVRAALVATTAVLLVAALAGPQYGYRWQEVERQGIDIIIALDCSRSMLAQDIQPTRLDRAKREIVDLLAMLQGDRVGLVAFSGSAFLQCPLTLDYAAFDLFLDVLTPDYLPVGGSDLAAAVKTALDGFDPLGTAEKAIILITDGENTGRGDPLLAAQAAAKADVKLFAIGVGSGEGVPVPAAGGGFKKDPNGQIVLTRLDEPLLTRMALATGGTYVRSVAGDLDLDAIYRDQIRAKMETATVESGRKQVWADRFQWPLAFAVALMFTALLLPPVKRPLVALLAPVVAGLVALAPGPVVAGPVQEGYKAYQQGEYDQALKRFIDGQLQDPDNPELLYNIGNTYYKRGDFDAAKDHYAQALGLADDQLKGKLLYNLGNTAYRQGAMQEAVENYQAALELIPEDGQARDNLDFVKKQMAQQQQQSQEGQSDAQQSDQTQDQSGQGQPQEQKEQQAQGSQGQDGEQHSSPQYGSEMSPERQSDQPSAQQSQQRPLQDAGQSEPQQAQQSAGQMQKGQDRQGHQAAQMLNRLKDEPGRAMMPNYQKRKVDKDW